MNIKILYIIVLTIILSGCASVQVSQKSSVIDYLYPSQDIKSVKPGLPPLITPLAVGIAFVPQGQELNQNPVSVSLWAGKTKPNELDDIRKKALLKIISHKFRQQKLFDNVQVIPPNYLTEKGGFENLDKIQTMYGIDVIALIAYNQNQFFTEGTSSDLYTTLGGEYLISGSQYDTGTLMDTTIYDVTSKTLLFRAQGTSLIKARAIPKNLTDELTEDSIQGFDFASEMMLRNLDNRLTHFANSVNK